MKVTKSNKEDLSKVLKNMQAQNDREYDWVKQVIFVLSTVLGLLIALKSNSSSNAVEHILFSIAILSTALCILSGLIFLHRDADTLHAQTLKYLKYIESRDENTPPKLIVSAPHRYYGIAKGIFVILLFVSVLSLISFAIYSDRVVLEDSQKVENEKTIEPTVEVLIQSQKKVDSLRSSKTPVDSLNIE